MSSETVEHRLFTCCIHLEHNSFVGGAPLLGRAVEIARCVPNQAKSRVCPVGWASEGVEDSFLTVRIQLEYHAASRRNGGGARTVIAASARGAEKSAR